jgi:hypothetical protein
MSACGMLAAINKARQAAWPGAREWQMLETTTPLAVSALRAAAAQGGTEAVVATLQERMEPLTPSPLEVPSVSVDIITTAIPCQLCAACFGAFAAVL